MAKLKISELPDEKPVKITLELSASVFRDLQAYAAAVGRHSDQPANDLGRLASAMVARFMATDRAFAKSKRIPVPKIK
ncbi:conserved protein of unknown function [Bradyrhizobium sp. ORS 285]|uniref:DUF2274 domain-containing protein n=1 Tax=Bradyrhizobium sp. ORS 285 TaxID=115808 RepID=UPI000240A547|nr:DUF2274 domain-containing protein [Bradyrhizobium sp. ORS 285]CCD84688.1 conserved hypothetical protein [Bradyrhizobium sp. ORS 285]SMX61209.1 conserved protein of unknown function [Bradyrhizobium sp. ORS 285]